MNGPTLSTCILHARSCITNALYESMFPLVWVHNMLFKSISNTKVTNQSI